MSVSAPASLQLLCEMCKERETRLSSPHLRVGQCHRHTSCEGEEGQASLLRTISQNEHAMDASTATEMRAQDCFMLSFTDALTH